MGERLQTSVDSVSIVGGVWQDKTSNIAVFEQSSLVPARRGRGNLYILIETVGNFPDHARAQQRIIEVAQAYFATDGSIAAGLRASIKAANEALFEINLNAPREARGVAGVTCIVLKDGDAYVGQAGPALLYQIGKGKCQVLPEDSTWLASQKLEDIDVARQPPLGLRRNIEPMLSHLHVQDGDVLILASTPLAKLASSDEINSAVMHRGAHTVRENLEAVIAGHDLSMLIIEVLSVDQALASAEKPTPRAAAGKRLGLGARVSATLRGLFLVEPQEQKEFEPEEEYEQEPLPESEREEETRPAAAPALDLRGALESAWHAVSGFFSKLLPVLARVLPSAEPQPHRTAQAGPHRKTQAAVQLKGKSSPMALGDRRWIWVLVALPVLLVLLYAVTRFQFERSQQAHVKRLVQAAQDAQASAEASPSIVDQRTKLREALLSLDKALQLKPGDKALTDERQAVQDLLDTKNYVSRLLYFGELKEFADVETAKSQLSRVIVHGIDLYVLDAGTDRVYKYLLNPTRDGLQPLSGDGVLVRKGDAQGEIVVDELLDMAWAQPSEAAAGSLLILDKKGHVLSYNPTIGFKVLPLASADVWRAPVAVATFYSRLYLLDPPANVVLRYEPTSAGYEATPSNYLKSETNVNVGNGIDISIDGNVYVLLADGQIKKFFQGASAPFSSSNLDEPMKAACCIFASGGADREGYIYLADTGNQRIVKLNKEGAFLRQFRSRDLQYMNALKGLFVDEEDKKLFLVNGNKLYWTRLPE